MIRAHWGVILYFSRFYPPARLTLQTMRDAILRLREKGKRALSYAPGYRTLDYFVASACDEIPAGAERFAGGLRAYSVSRSSLKRAWRRPVCFSMPWRSRPIRARADALTRSEPSPEGREQTNWLLDSVYDIIIDGIARHAQNES